MIRWPEVHIEGIKKKWFPEQETSKAEIKKKKESKVKSNKWKKEKEKEKKHITKESDKSIRR